MMMNVKRKMKLEKILNKKKSVVSGCNTLFCQPTLKRKKKNIKNEHENRHHLLCCKFYSPDGLGKFVKRL